MLVDKITTGFVIQTFDTETGKYVSQSFVAGDQTDYEKDAEPVDLAECGTLDVTYLPYEMIQPDDNGNIEPIMVINPTRLLFGADFCDDVNSEDTTDPDDPERVALNIEQAVDAIMTLRAADLLAQHNVSKVVNVLNVTATMKQEILALLD